MQLLPVLLTVAYLGINFALVVWIARQEAHDRVIPSWVVVVGRILRYGPPLIGLGYLVTIAGDWPFFLFVVGFFTFAFFLLDRSLGFPSLPKRSSAPPRDTERRP